MRPKPATASTRCSRPITSITSCFHPTAANSGRQATTKAPSTSSMHRRASRQPSSMFRAAATSMGWSGCTTTKPVWPGSSAIGRASITAPVRGSSSPWQKSGCIRPAMPGTGSLECAVEKPIDDSAGEIESQWRQGIERALMPIQHGDSLRITGQFPKRFS